MKVNINVYCMTEFSVAVVGEKEQSGGTVNVRTRDNTVHGEFSIEAVTQKFQALKDKRSQNSEVDF
jgi:threonyl-tRNA synthetase